MTAINYSKRVTLSTDSPLSVSKVPVAIIDGVPRNPTDMIEPIGEFSAMFSAETAANLVSHSYCPSYIRGSDEPATEKDAMYHAYIRSLDRRMAKTDF